MSSFRGFPNPKIEPMSPTLAGGLFTSATWEAPLSPYMLSHFSHVCLCGSIDCSPSGPSAHGIVPARILDGVGCHALFWGIFLTQGSNLHLLHFRQILYHLCHQGSLIPAHTSILNKNRVITLCVSPEPIPSASQLST